MNYKAGEVKTGLGAGGDGSKEQSKDSRSKPRSLWEHSVKVALLLL